MLKPVRVTPPSDLPLTIEEMRRQCNITSSGDDAMLNFLCKAGVDYLDGYTGILGRCLMPQTWRIDLDEWPSCHFRLPLAPVQSITEIKYFDPTNQQLTWNAANYALYEDALSPFVAWSSGISPPSIYERLDAVSVTFVAGYGSRALVPAGIKHGLLMWIGTMFMQRENIILGTIVSELPGGGDLLRQFCRGGLS